MKNTSKKSTLWWMLVAAPLFFLAAIVGASVYFGLVTQGKDPAAIPQLVADSTPWQLVLVQVCLLLLLRGTLRREGLSWREIGWGLEPGQKAWREALIGILPGVALALLYFFALSPLLTRLQQVWDYVPAGELFTALGASLVPFAVADVLLAPFVEESLYRGYALTRLLGKFGRPAAVALSCFFFGLLHWTGGFWYILLTGIVAGGLFAALRLARRNLIAPFAAHLALNILETLFILLGIGG